MSATLYVLCELDEDDNIVGFVKGGGSSAPSNIRAYESPASARSALQRIRLKPERTAVVEFDQRKLSQ